MIKNNVFKTKLNKVSVKGEEVYRVTGQMRIKILKNIEANKTEANCKGKFKGIWVLSGVNVVSEGRLCCAT